MVKKMLLLMTLIFSLAFGTFWSGQAQDPAAQNPANVRTDPPTVSANQTQTVQTDLSGTYTGTFNCEALGLMGPTTLTITGNDFTTADGKTGRIVASTTGGYTAVALTVGGMGTASTGAAAMTGTTATPMTPPTVVSMRARKSGTRLTLTPVSGSANRCSFVPGRGVARGRRNQQAQPEVPAATGTEVSNPAATPTPSESPATPEQTPSPSPSPSPTPSGSPSPMPSPSPGEPVPSPTPGEPTPVPSPSPGEPTPSPSPTEPSPSPGPSPSPSPSPSPRLIRG